MILLMGNLRPFEHKSEFRVEIWNEFCVLLVYALCLLQTDFVEDPHLRTGIAWSLNALLALSVLTNFGHVLYLEGSSTFRSTRLGYLKFKQNAKLEKQKKID